MIESLGFTLVIFIVGFLAIAAMPEVRYICQLIATLITLVTIVAIIGLFFSGEISVSHIMNSAVIGFKGQFLLPLLTAVAIIASCSLICGQDGISGEELTLLTGTAILADLTIVNHPMGITVKDINGNMNNNFSNSFFILFVSSMLVIVGFLLKFGTEKAKRWHAGYLAKQSGGDGDGEGGSSNKKIPTWVIVGAIVGIIGIVGYYNYPEINSWVNKWTQSEPVSASGKGTPPTTEQPKQPVAQAPRSTQPANTANPCDCIQSERLARSTDGSGISYGVATCRNGQQIKKIDLVGKNVPRCQ